MTEADKKKRRIFTRRRFLWAGGTVIAASGLGVGGYWIHDHRRRFGRDVTAVIPDHRVELPAVLPKMVIAKGGDPALNVRAVVERLGGMERLLTRNDIVVVKPNIGWRRPPELAALMRPTLTVVDASRVLMRGGPSGGGIGAVKQVGAIAAGFDPVALDTWAGTIFGTDPDDLPEYLRIAENMGLGTSDFESLSPVEISGI